MNVLGVGPVIEKQVFAKIFLVFGTIETHAAGRGVQRHHAHALLEALDVGPDLFDDTCQFVAKQRRRHNHAGMVAPLIHLQIGAAGQGNLHLDQNFPFAQLGNRHLLDLYVLFAIEDRRCHISVHSKSPSISCPAVEPPSSSLVWDGQPSAVHQPTQSAENDG